ncbi:MAG: hypothetical protein JRE23_02740 [Deltaproteobacteria bacterium]|nr:hypothetical protein [Deltaproteobacteria bacterium]
MSMGGGAGASTAAKEIMGMIEVLLDEYKDSTEAVEALKKVIKRCNEIKDAGDTGWY